MEKLRLLEWDIVWLRGEVGWLRDEFSRFTGLRRLRDKDVDNGEEDSDEEDNDEEEAHDGENDEEEEEDAGYHDIDKGDGY